MRLSLLLDPRDPLALRELAAAVSDPASPRYGRHLDRGELAAEVSLPPDERRALLGWFESRGLHVSDEGALGGQRITLDASAERLADALGPAFVRALGERRYLPSPLCRQALPRRLAGYVRAVTAAPSVAPEPVVVRATEVTPPPVAGGVTPAMIARGYGFDGDHDGRGETIAILAFGGMPDAEDLLGFWRAFGVPAPAVELVPVGPLGSRATDPLCRLETTMAVQWAGALSPGARIVVYLVDPAAVADPWSELLLAALSDVRRAPTVVVTTWSCPERQYYRVHGGELVRGLLDQLAVLGVTVIAATGDSGACDGLPGLRAGGGRVCDAPWPGASFPAAEERVLAVGGTHVRAVAPWAEAAWSAPVSPALRDAIALDALAGSGGFSAQVGVPAWQRPALAASHPRSGGAPATAPFGRGVPDVALMAWGPEEREGGAGYACLLDGAFRSDAGGTSVAAPVWAAAIARVNEARLRRGGARVGFAQPLLYRLAAGGRSPFRAVTEGATDITVPAFDGGGGVAPTVVAGYLAHAGWNPATGLGVPDVAALCSNAGDAP